MSVLRGQYDYPAPALFAVVFVLSAFYFLAGDPLSKALCFLTLVWGLLGLMRGLWMIETVFLLEDQDSDQRSAVLPWLILKGMDLRVRLDCGFRALRSVDRVMVLLMVLGGAYGAWMVYISVVPSLPDAALLIGARIYNFFDQQSGEPFVVSLDPALRMMMFDACRLLVLAISCWMARTYVLSMRRSHLVLGICAGVFVLALFAALYSWAPAQVQGLQTGALHGYGQGVTPVIRHLGAMNAQESYSTLSLQVAEIGLTGVTFLWACGGVAALSLLKNALSSRSGRGRLYAAGGLLVLGAMVMVYCQAAYQPGLSALYYSGWVLLAALLQFSSTRTGSSALK
jgi:hypothetical protein